MEKIITREQAIRKLTSMIMEADDNLRRNAEFAKLEHHDGKIKLTRWGDIAAYSRTKYATNVRTWMNGLLNRAAVREQVEEFIDDCISHDLPLCVFDPRVKPTADR